MFSAFRTREWMNYGAWNDCSDYGLRQYKKGQVVSVLNQLSTMTRRRVGGVDVWVHVLLTSALVRGEWSTWRPCRFSPGERASGIPGASPTSCPMDTGGSFPGIHRPDRSGGQPNRRSNGYRGKSLRYPLDRWFGWPQGRSGRSYQDSNYDLPVAQPAVSRYTDCAVVALK
jgi:hypothetical protein